MKNSDNGTKNSDVRMRGFAKRVPVEAAWRWIDGQAAPLGPETVPVAQANGRILAQDVTSTVNVPGFPRSMMDGYAVRAENTLGATDYNHLHLSVVGEVLPGRDPAVTVGSGQAARIMTGAPMPPGADAVIPVEMVEADHAGISARDAVAPGKNVGRVGEDIEAGTVVFRAGRKLRPQDLGVLSSIGVSRVEAVKRPRVRLVTTGNELLPPGEQPRGFQIVDANSPMLEALVARDAGLPINPGIVPDDEPSILNAMRDDADVILVSGGSSVGKEDHAPQLVSRHGELAIHGVAMRPSSPAGMGVLDSRLVFLLPGNPVSCLCAYDFFAGRAIRILGGLPKEWPYRTIDRPLRRKIVSKVGRLDYARIKLVDDQVEPLAISGASMLSSTTRADGFVILDESSEGAAPNSIVSVHLYDT